MILELKKIKLLILEKNLSFFNEKFKKFEKFPPRIINKEIILYSKNNFNYIENLDKSV